MQARIGSVLAAAALAFAAQAAAQTMVFINPGKSDEVYWVTAAHAMESAARDLGVKLEVLYAQRDHMRTIEFARDIAARPAAARPEFVILSNDNATGPEIVRILDAAGVKTFLAFSSIPAEGRGETLGPREKYKGWLGSLEPHAEDAGYMTARALIAQGRKANARAADGRLHLIAIAGDRTTPSSVRRNDGMQKAVAESHDVVVDQVVYAGWARDKAAEQAEWLFARYPEARLVWAGNDLMAFGAMQALEKRGGVPGKDAFFSGVNTSKEAMDALASGRLTALAGGHFITGAWAVVMLYDYAHGRDFRDEGLELDSPMFASFDARSAAVFMARYGENFDSVGFRRYSKALNPKLKRYDFGFAQLLR
ncbi:MAG TPA: ABC transporter substrate-binding protein [Usitatibacter sp.]|nr:ABC transporter substrate-binding protein [Usitatibacter sp.]